MRLQPIPPVFTATGGIPDGGLYMCLECDVYWSIYSQCWVCGKDGFLRHPPINRLKYPEGVRVSWDDEEQGLILP